MLEEIKTSHERSRQSSKMPYTSLDQPSRIPVELRPCPLKDEAIVNSSHGVDLDLRLFGFGRKHCELCYHGCLGRQPFLSKSGKDIENFNDPGKLF